MVMEHGIEQKGRWHLIFGIFGLVKHNQHQCRIRFPWKSKVVNQLWLFLIKMDFVGILIGLYTLISSYLLYTLNNYKLCDYDKSMSCYVEIL